MVKQLYRKIVPFIMGMVLALSVCVDEVKGGCVCAVFGAGDANFW